MINRDRYLITKNILKLLSEGNKSAPKIMYACRLSNGQRHVYLNSLIEKGLMTNSNDTGTGRTTYAITGIGMQVLEVLESLYNLCPFIMDAGLSERVDSYQLI